MMAARKRLKKDQGKIKDEGKKNVDGFNKFKGDPERTKNAKQLKLAETLKSYILEGSEDTLLEIENLIEEKGEQAVREAAKLIDFDEVREKIETFSEEGHVDFCHQEKRVYAYATLYLISKDLNDLVNALYEGVEGIRRYNMKGLLSNVVELVKNDKRIDKIVESLLNKRVNLEDEYITYTSLYVVYPLTKNPSDLVRAVENYLLKVGNLSAINSGSEEDFVAEIKSIEPKYLDVLFDHMDFEEIEKKIEAIEDVEKRTAAYYTLYSLFRAPEYAGKVLENYILGGSRREKIYRIEKLIDDKREELKKGKVYPEGSMKIDLDDIRKIINKDDWETAYSAYSILYHLTGSRADMKEAIKYYILAGKGIGREVPEKDDFNFFSVISEIDFNELEKIAEKVGDKLRKGDIYFTMSKVRPSQVPPNHEDPQLRNLKDAVENYILSSSEEGVNRMEMLGIRYLVQLVIWEGSRGASSREKFYKEIREKLDSLYKWGERKGYGYHALYLLTYEDRDYLIAKERYEAGKMKEMLSRLENVRRAIYEET